MISAQLTDFIIFTDSDFGPTAFIWGKNQTFGAASGL
jgi:hypothetical protein